MKYIFISQGQFDPTLAYITTAITETAHTNIHSLEHSTTWDALAQIKTRPYNNTNKQNYTGRNAFCLLCLLYDLSMYIKMWKVTWTTFNSKPTHSNTQTTLTLADATSSKTAAWFSKQASIDSR